MKSHAKMTKAELLKELGDACADNVHLREDLRRRDEALNEMWRVQDQLREQLANTKLGFDKACTKIGRMMIMCNLSSLTPEGLKSVQDKTGEFKL